MIKVAVLAERVIRNMDNWWVAQHKNEEKYQQIVRCGVQCDFAYHVSIYNQLLKNRFTCRLSRRRPQAPSLMLILRKSIQPTAWASPNGEL